MGSLALDLFREVRPGLFRVLAGRNAATYVDVLDVLEIESSQRDEGMDIMISDGTWCLCLNPVNHKEPDGIKFLTFEQSTQTVDFPEIKPSAPSTGSARKGEG